jgi:hypothetical protein
MTRTTRFAKATATAGIAIGLVQKLVLALTLCPY